MIYESAFRLLNQIALNTDEFPFQGKIIKYALTSDPPFANLPH